MSVLSTKKPSPPNTIRRLEDHPKWQEAVETQRRLQREQELIDEAARQTQGLAGKSSQQNRIGNAVDAIMAKVNGQPGPHPGPTPARRLPSSGKPLRRRSSGTPLPCSGFATNCHP